MWIWRSAGALVLGVLGVPVIESPLRAEAGQPGGPKIRSRVFGSQFSLAGQESGRRPRAAGLSIREAHSGMCISIPHVHAAFANRDITLSVVANV